MKALLQKEIFFSPVSKEKVDCTFGLRRLLKPLMMNKLESEVN